MHLSRRFGLAFLGLAWLLAAGAEPCAAQGGRRGDKLVFIVRHAEKASATDPDPSLSDAGKARAAALAEALSDAEVTDVLVTPRKRTVETAAMVTEARKLTARVVAFGASTDEHTAAIAQAVKKSKGNTVLVVGHSNTVPAIIAALGGPRIPELCDAQYAGLYIMRLSVRGIPRLVRAQYGAADPPGAGNCAASTMR